MLNSWSQLLFLFNTVFLVFLAKEEFRINKKLIVVSILVPATFVSPVAGIALLFLLEWFFVVPNFLKKEKAKRTNAFLSLLPLGIYVFPIVSLILSKRLEDPFLVSLLISFFFLLRSVNWPFAIYKFENDLFPEKLRILFPHLISLLAFYHLKAYIAQEHYFLFLGTSLICALSGNIFGYVTLATLGFSQEASQVLICGSFLLIISTLSRQAFAYAGALLILLSKGIDIEYGKNMYSFVFFLLSFLFIALNSPEIGLKVKNKFFHIIGFVWVTIGTLVFCGKDIQLSLLTYWDLFLVVFIFFLLRGTTHFPKFMQEQEYFALPDLLGRSFEENLSSPSLVLLDTKKQKIGGVVQYLSWIVILVIFLILGEAI